MSTGRRRSWRNKGFRSPWQWKAEPRGENRAAVGAVSEVTSRRVPWEREEARMLPGIWTWPAGTVTALS